MAQAGFLAAWRPWTFARLVLVAAIAALLSPALPAEEADSLPQGAVLRFGSPGLRTSSFVHAVGFLADGRTVVSVGAGIEYWDVETGRAKRAVRVGGVQGSFSPDGGFILGSGPSDAELVDLEKGEVLARLEPEGGFGGQLQVALSTGAQRIALGTEGGLFCVLGGANREELWSDKLGKGGIAAVALSADGVSLATASRGEIILWEAETGRRIRSWQVPKACALVFSPDGRRLAVGRNYAPTTILEVGEDKKEIVLGDKPAALGPVAFSPDGARVATGDREGVIQIWELSTGKEVTRCGRHAAPVFCVAFSPDGNLVASGASDNMIGLWDAATGKETIPHEGHSGLVMGLTFTPDARQIISCDFHTSVLVWDARDGKELRRIEGKRTIALSRDGLVLACGGPGESVQLVELSSGRRLEQLRINPYDCADLVFSADGRSLLAMNYQGACRVWDIERARRLDWSPGGKGGVTGVAITPEGTRCLVASSNGRLRCVGWGSDESEWETTPSSPPLGVAVGPDGRLAATLSEVGDIELVLARTGEPVASIDANTEPSRMRRSSGVRHRIDFCPNAGFLVSFDEGGVLRLYEIATQSLLAAQQTETSQAFSSALAPRGSRYAVGGGDGTVMVWDLLALDGSGSTAPADDLWRDLASADARIAYRAMCGLVALGPRAVERMGRDLGPAEAETASLKELIRGLDHDDPATRDRATRGLSEAGEAARTALEECLQTPSSPEAAGRARELLKDLDSGQIHDPDALRASRALWVLEGMGSSEARALLDRLAHGAPGARLTRESAAALERTR